MITFRRILVDIDALGDDHPALDRALEFAGRCGATVSIVDVLPDVPSRARHFVTPAVEQELVDDRWSRLSALAAKAGDRVQAALLRGSPAIALVQEAMAGEYDLLVRSHGRDLQASPPPFGPIDMQLLRKCPCPVWLIAPGRAARPRRILAAIDASCNDPGEAALNGRIIDLALTVRAFEQATLTVFYAWSAFGHSLLQNRMSSREFDDFVAAERDAAAQDLQGFRAALGDRGADVAMELAPGEPHEAILAFVRSHDIDLVVMGSVVRTGLAGFVMGHTAERVLRELRGSVLAIKPRGFVSPVTGHATAAARR